MMTPERASALDLALRTAEAEFCCHAPEARAEVRALRDRVADLEAVMRAQFSGRFRIWRTIDNGWAWSCGGPRPDGFLSDDGTDFPVLTDAARAALRTPEVHDGER